MKKRILIILWLLFSVSLIFFTLWKFAEPIHHKRLEVIRISKIQKVCMKEYARKRDYHIPQRNTDKAKVKIAQLLKLQPILFEENSVSIDNNQSTDMNLSHNRVVLARVIDVLNNINEDVILNIEVHTDTMGSNQHNLQLSQRRADILKRHIEKQTNLLLITSIGYGEEFPLSKVDDNISNRRIEIKLKRVQ